MPTTYQKVTEDYGKVTYVFQQLFPKIVSVCNASQDSNYDFKFGRAKAKDKASAQDHLRPLHAISALILWGIKAKSKGTKAMVSMVKV